ncbi:MAG: hypothetical protein L0Y79_06305 [Chlorobi bacterium]|nr:hypothetical protein [Chlorobiota bacterium]MCI0715343.1 hypothetical protein [Chlorobiota bacterium]
MYDTLFYFFFAAVIVSAMYISFSENIYKTFFALLIFLISVRGIFTMLLSELFALIGLLALILLLSLILIFSSRLENLVQKVNIAGSSTNFPFIIAIGLMTAIVSGLVTSTRWRLFALNYDLNTYMLIFSKYLPALLAVCFALFIIVSSLGFILKKGAAKTK